MPQFDSSSFSPQIFWLIVCFGFLFTLMTWVLVPRLSKVIAAREKRLQEDFDRAKTLLEEVEVLRREAQDRLHTVRISAKETHQQAIEAMQHEKSLQLHNMHEKAAHDLSLFFQKLLDERHEFNKGLSDVITQSVMTLAPLLMGHKPSTTSLSPIVQAIIKERHI